MTTETGMIHTCNILSRTTATKNEYGEAATYTDSSQNNVACRFFTTNKVSGRILSGASGEHILSVPMVMIPPTATVNRGDLIVSTVTGFAGTFRVENVNPIYWLFYNYVHHYECELEAIQ